MKKAPVLITLMLLGGCLAADSIAADSIAPGAFAQSFELSSKSDQRPSEEAEEAAAVFEPSSEPREQAFTVLFPRLANGGRDLPRRSESGGRSAPVDRGEVRLRRQAR